MYQRGKGILACLAIAVYLVLRKIVPGDRGCRHRHPDGDGHHPVLEGKGAAGPGIQWTSKVVLQAAVVFLGFGLDLHAVAATGKQSLPIILSTITTSLVLSYVLHRLLVIPTKISTLVGVGSSICGGSAIAAAAPAIQADDEEVAQAISVIFFFNVLAAILFPPLGDGPGVQHRQRGRLRDLCWDGGQ